MQELGGLGISQSAPRILVVDDNADNLALLGEILSGEYRVQVANSGSRALVLASDQPQPDLILLDIMMPGMDGNEVFRRLRGDIRTREIPVIFLSALSETADEEHGLLLGAVDYITKPIRSSILLARVRTQLSAKQVRDFLRDKNSFLEKEVERRIRDYTLVQEVTIHALARIAETRDPETGNHLMRTQEYVRCLAETLCNHPRFSGFLTERNVQLLPKSAPLHDIGKVGIPDHILLKPGKLSAEEWVIMRTHAKLGRDAIEAAEKDTQQEVEFLSLAKDIAHYHHERWDGGGYPEGLSGDAIPVAARLMAIADVFDALISRRVYKPPMPLEKARELILAERGKHFDPDVVDAFLKVYEEFIAIATRYSDGEQAVWAKIAAKLPGEAPS